MTDIVDRLRAGWSMPNLAADEIERLRAYSDELAASYRRLTNEASEEIGRLRLEIEHTRAERDALVAKMASAVEELNDVNGFDQVSRAIAILAASPEP